MDRIDEMAEHFKRELHAMSVRDRRSIGQRFRHLRARLPLASKPKRRVRYPKAAPPTRFDID